MLSPQESQKLQRMLGLLRAGMRKEIKRLKQGEGNGSLVTDQLMQMDISRWNDEQVVLKLLRELWLKEQVISGMGQPEAEMMLSILDDESVLLGLEGSLAGADDESSAPAA
jgi:CTP-dependent riboflavin kinase